MSDMLGEPMLLRPRMPIGMILTRARGVYPPAFIAAAAPIGIRVVGAMLQLRREPLSSHPGYTTRLEVFGIHRCRCLACGAAASVVGIRTVSAVDHSSHSSYNPCGSPTNGNSTSSTGINLPLLAGTNSFVTFLPFFSALGS